MDFYFTREKLGILIEILKKNRAMAVSPITDLRVIEDASGEVNPAVPLEAEGWSNIKTGYAWEGYDKYLWLTGTLTFPESWKGKGLLCGKFDFGLTGGGHNSGFESLLFVDGKPYQGVDSNHTEVYFDESYIGRPIQLVFRLWSGLCGGGAPVVQKHEINIAEARLIDIDTDTLSYAADMAIQALDIVGDTSTDRVAVQRAVEDAFAMIPWTDEPDEDFYASVSAALDKFNSILEKAGKHTGVDVKCVGHTHIDVAWLWRYKHTREKAIRSFSTVLRLMDAFPEYIFFQSQPQLYDYIKSDCPELYEQIKQRIAEGRWEIDGAMWVEPDCNLTSGESLTRQILMGSRFAEKEFGKKMTCLWLPDVFGYSWALPQILKKSGINTFITTKISWNEYNRMPNDTFTWVGIDGSEVMTHFITTPIERINDPHHYYSYNGMIDPAHIAGVWDNYRNKDISNEVLVSYGYGDGGGGVTRDHLMSIRAVDKLPGLPNAENGHVGEFIEKLRANLDAQGWKKPTWDGELYLEFHRGTYTSHAAVKKMNRVLELAYRNSEWLSVASGLLTGNCDTGDQEKLNDGWKIILRNQFHDVLPGSSIREVYEDTAIEHQEAMEIANAIADNAMANISSKKDGAYTIINNSGWKTSGIVEIPDMSGVSYYDADGNMLVSQQGRGKDYVLVPDAAPLSASSIYFKQSAPEALEVPFSYADRELITPYYRICLNSVGQITSIFDKENNRDVMRSGERGNVLQVFTDRPYEYDAWNMDIYYQEQMTEITDLVSMAMTECGPLRAVIHFVWRYNKSQIEQDMIVYSSSRRIDFKTYVDLHETHKAFKAAFPVDIRSSYAAYDIQYGNVRRSNNKNTSWDIAKFETVNHKWFDLSEPTYGVSLLNDCKYGCDVSGNVLRLTLLRCATYPDYVQDQGEHEFTYALLPHAGDVYHSDTEKEAFMLNSPMYSRMGEGCVPSTFTLSDDFVEVDAVKRAEDGGAVILRFHEYTGSKRTVTITPGFEYAEWAESDLMEHPISDFKAAGNITLTVKPYEIKTLIFKL